jgi:RNA polymerase sigma factor (TIGR02999 family)
MPEQDVTRLLLAWRAGDEQARDHLMAAVYDELRRRAASYLRRERPGHALQATALVHEAYMRLVDQDRVAWQNRAHFMAVAANVMRRILVDHARAERSQKRGGAGQRITLAEDLAAAAPRELELLELEDALQELAGLDPQQARVVELRYFGGLSIEETSQALDVSPATVKRDWTMARAWLFRRLQGGRTPGEGSA